MDRLIRCITNDGSVSAIAVDSTDIAYKSSIIHKTFPIVSIAQGELLTAASMMGSMLKSDKSSISIRLKGDGPVDVMIAVSDHMGNVKGYVANSNVESYNDGKLIDVSDAVGKSGIINVMKDFGFGEPYIGQLDFVSGRIAEEITNYYAKSEQLPTLCSLGVLIDKESKQVLLSGGLMIQLLPGADDNTITKIENNIEKLDNITTMMAKGLSLEEMVNLALDGFVVEVLDESPVKYVCSCSKEKIMGQIATFSVDEILDMADKDNGASAFCHFCNKNYTFTREELLNIANKKNKNQ